ncbi:response regulator [Kiloniella majae]|uniref:response regulator n=1 Tax=Kiloniella majae TaxID=1938558 RepID=UPI000A277FFD|nr:response regulator [Kiloniella majae]
MKLLYVEDQPMNTRVLRLFVEQLWGEVLSSVETAEDSFDLILEEDFDLVYMDINLPHMNGLEAIRYIKNTLKKNDLPIIVVSADTSEKVIADAYDSGCRAYIKKPVSIIDFKDITERVLNTDETIAVA